MQHIIDGYNLLFFLEFKEKTLKKGREFVIDYVSESFKSKNGVCIVFDGKQEKGLGFSRIKIGKVEVIYTIDGMSADEFIIEWFHQKKHGAYVYTHDLGLKRQLSEYKVKVVDFTAFEIKKSRSQETGKHNEISDPRYEQYLLETFNKKLKL